MRQSFLSDIQTIRERARKHIDEGAVTENYGAHKTTALKLPQRGAHHRGRVHAALPARRGASVGIMARRHGRLQALRWQAVPDRSPDERVPTLSTYRGRRGCASSVRRSAPGSRRVAGR
jgi:hypothetical protein